MDWVCNASQNKLQYYSYSSSLMVSLDCVTAFSVFGPSCMANSQTFAYHYIAPCNYGGQVAEMCQQGHSACVSVSAYFCGRASAPAYL